MLKNTKCLKLIIVTIILVLGFFPKPVVVSGENDLKESGVTFAFDENSGVLSFSGVGEMPEYDHESQPWLVYQDRIKKIVIGEGITSVSANAFKAYDMGEWKFYHNLTEVVLPSTINVIKSSAFYNCGNLVSINLPEGLSEIESFALADTKIDNIVLPGTMRILGTAALQRKNDGISNIVLNEGLETIGNSCFLYAGISSLSIPSTVSFIGNNAFSCCNKLEGVYIPDTVKYLGNSAFNGCEKLRYATVCGEYDLGYEVFGRCPALEMVVLSDGMTGIDESFRNCNNLLYVYVPTSVKSINPLAFFCEKPRLVTLFSPGSHAAYDMAEKDVYVNYADMNDASQRGYFDGRWNACKLAPLTPKPVKLLSISPFKISAGIGKMKITITTVKEAKIVVKLNKKLIRKNGRAYKSVTIKSGKKSNVIKLSKKAPKGLLITVKITKNGYKTKTKKVKL